MAYSQVNAGARKLGNQLYGWASTVVYMSDHDMTPGQYWRAYRESKGWGLRFVAKRAGLSHGTVSNFEKRIGGYEAMEAGSIARLARGYGQTEAVFRSSLKDAGIPPEGSGSDSLRSHQERHRFPVRKAASAGADQPEYLNGVYVYVPEQTLLDHQTSADYVDLYYADGSCVISDEAKRVEKPVIATDTFAVDKYNKPKRGAVAACWWADKSLIALIRHQVDEDGVLLHSFDPLIPPLKLPKLTDLKIIGRVFWRGG